jgi:hypothetical protein
VALLPTADRRVVEAVAVAERLVHRAQPEQQQGQPQAPQAVEVVAVAEALQVHRIRTEPESIARTMAARPGRS